MKLSAHFLIPLALLVLSTASYPALAQSPTPLPPTPTPQPTATAAPVPTITPAMAVEVRQPPAPPQSFWDRYGVVTAVISAIIGGIMMLIFTSLLGPTVKEWGENLKGWLKGGAGRFREKYIPALAEEHRYLKLVGIHGKEGLPPPLLREVYVSLRMGGTGASDPLAPPLSIAEALTNHRHLLILGEPGAGKSTLLDYLTLVFADEIEAPALHRHEKCLPIFLPLRNCVADDRPLHELMAEPALLPLDETPPEDFLKAELDRGRCLVLLDGLDEVVDERQRKLAADKINDLLRTYPNNRYLVTCRTAGWQEGLLTGDLARLYVRDFDDGDIDRFVHAWYRAVRSRAVWLRGDLTPAGRQKALARAQQRADDEANALLTALKHNRGLYQLARNPLILSLIALVHYRRRDLPQGRAKLYQECLEILLDVWDQEDKDLKVIGPSLGAKETILREIAYHFHVKELTEAGRVELEALIAPLIPSLDCPTGPVETLRQIEERSGILVSRAIDRYRFAHRTLQEYLVARVLADSPEKASQVLAHVNDEPWREVILLYAGLIKDVNKLVRALLAQPDDLHHNALTLAGQCLAEDVQAAPALREQVLEELKNAFRAADDALILERLEETLALVGDDELVSLWREILATGRAAQRAVAARALGRLGADDEDTLAALLRLYPDDPADVARHAALQALLALGQAERVGMVLVPAGRFLMGSPADDREARKEEKPQHEIYLPDFYIDRTPVTNAQYRCFIEAGGYARAAYWAEASAAGRWEEGAYIDYGGTPRTHPYLWDEPSLNSDQQPVVGVSWYEALAYTRWAGVRLPSEAEWEKAAGWDQAAGRKRRYPWGDEWQDGRANVGKAEARGGVWARVRRVFRRKALEQASASEGRTTPVDAYPDGASPCGALDMAGNVFEWCQSDYKTYPYDPDDGREDLGGGDDVGRVLRGGSWLTDRSWARCAYRNGYYPWNGDHHLRGFRCCCATSSPPAGSGF